MGQKKRDGDAICETAYEARSFWRLAWVVFSRDRAAMAGGALAVLLLSLAVVGPYLAPRDPKRPFFHGVSELGEPLAPCREFPLGTDHLGRDVLSRLLWGGRISLGIGLTGNLLAVALGVILGAIAGYLEGLPETAIMRFTDVVMGFPVLLLAVALVAVLEPTPLTVALVIGSVNWTYLNRIIYSVVRALKEREFMIAARSVGVPHLRILIRHVLPHLTSVVVVYASLGMTLAVMLESTLSYVGVGVQPPTPSWGSMINEGQTFYRSAPWLVLFPGALIGLTVLAFNLLGDGLRDAMDPYTVTRRA